MYMFPTRLWTKNIIIIIHLLTSDDPKKIPAAIQHTTRKMIPRAQNLKHTCNFELESICSSNMISAGSQNRLNDSKVMTLFIYFCHINCPPNTDQLLFFFPTNQLKKIIPIFLLNQLLSNCISYCILVAIVVNSLWSYFHRRRMHLDDLPMPSSRLRQSRMKQDSSRMIPIHLKANTSIHYHSSNMLLLNVDLCRYQDTYAPGIHPLPITC